MTTFVSVIGLVVMYIALHILMFGGRISIKLNNPITTVKEIVARRK